MNAARDNPPASATFPQPELTHYEVAKSLGRSHLARRSDNELAPLDELL